MFLAPLAAQRDFPSLDAPAPRAHQFLRYVAEPLEVPANKRAALEVRLEVEPGYHINSHKPKSELLLPTVLTLEPAQGVALAAAEYPAGQQYTPAFDPAEKLDVYAGTFTVRVPVTAAPGAHELHATLRYQACDRAVCYPPKTLALTIPFTAH